jgi:multisubunit Na+/H+ antiporter MnhG subunit
MSERYLLALYMNGIHKIYLCTAAILNFVPSKMFSSSTSVLTVLFWATLIAPFVAHIQNRIAENRTSRRTKNAEMKAFQFAKTNLI